MRIGIIGCGYVFDHYMATWARHADLEIAGVADIDAVRLKAATAFYKLHAYASTEALLADASIEIVLNLTSIESHYDVTQAALNAGKHVYSEKPLVTDMVQAVALFTLAESRGLRLSCAPSNALSDTSQTMWRAVRDGLAGDVRIVYAEFDDNVIYKMQPETWRSRSGAPWPYLHEYEQGCTFEHVGYHLTWLLTMFGPVEHVTAFSAVSLPDKTNEILNPSDTPDFSVACLAFKSGVIGRVTCSIGVPYDHRMRIIGNKGIVSADTYRHYQSPVYFERFNQLALNARKSISVRTNTLLQKLFGVGGRRLKLLRVPAPGANGRDVLPAVKWWSPRQVIHAIRRKELGQQDKAIGVAELAQAIQQSRPAFPPHDFTLHLTELTLAIQRAGRNGAAITLESSFAPIKPSAAVDGLVADYTRAMRPSLLERLSEKVIVRLHKH